ncbi:uncharacterized protein LOC119388758 [Rhipicephalus sanguineus]|uniref:uncharacterized protein LOC119388758 n=1 Tax=Rhipicephalus sanguineus TaxID=34632 RepID=UPI0020C2622E|nr:uncharacterized protein LOC119388758 [Rhipicephalus sanguineus]
MALVGSEEEQNPCDPGHGSHRSVFSTAEQQHTTHHLRGTSPQRRPKPLQCPATSQRWPDKEVPQTPGSVGPRKRAQPPVKMPAGEAVRRPVPVAPPRRVVHSYGFKNASVVFKAFRQRGSPDDVLRFRQVTFALTRCIIQNYDAINPDGLCDFAFIPMYVRTDHDSLKDDSHVDLQKLFAMATRPATTTKFAISFPHRRNAEVIADVKDPQGQAKLQDYWNKNIFHHAVLDLEVKPWEHLNIQTEVRAVFELLKTLKAWQERVNASHPKTAAPQGGFVVLGIRIWPANKKPFLGNVTQQMEQFPVDGFVPWTHFTEDEFEAKYPECVITGASPMTDSNNNNTLDMFEVMDWVNSSVTWNIHPSLAVSVSMCTRIYMTSTGMDAKYGDKCVDNQTPPGPSSMYCNDEKKYYHTFDTHYPDLAGYGYNLNFSEFIATFELQAAVTEKLCEVKYRYEYLDISLALFNIECEDWEDVCTTTDSNVVKGRDRIGYIHQYSSGTSLAMLKARSIPDCP